MDNKKILILGVGNILLCDEGFGIHAMEYLRNNYIWSGNVRFLDGATLGLMLMGEIMESDFVVVLDIAMCGDPPGTFYCLENSSINKSLSFNQSTHQTGIIDVLTSCSLAGACPETVVYCMEPFDCQTVSASLSPDAQERLPEFCNKVVEELEKKNIVIKPR